MFLVEERKKKGKTLSKKRNVKVFLISFFNLKYLKVIKLLKSIKFNRKVTSTNVITDWLNENDEIFDPIRDKKYFYNKRGHIK